MGRYVTATGFQRKTLAEIKSELETAFQGVFGEDIDLDAEGPFGQLVGLLSRREAQLWDAAQEIYTSRDPSQATGVSLDNIAAETGVSRIGAGRTVVSDVLLYGEDGAAVPSTLRLRQPNGPTDFRIDAATAISLAAARDVELDVDEPSSGGGESYTVAVDGVDYTYVAVAGDGKREVVNALVAAIAVGEWGGTAVNREDRLSLRHVTVDFSVSASATLSFTLLASAAGFTAVDAGPYPVPPATLTTVVTPVTGLDEAVNPAAGVTGRNAETDEELRIRRDQSLIAGNATEEAIRSGLLNRVEGIQQVSVRSNRTLELDTEGRPPKSFEVVAVGGTDEDIGQVIWQTMPAGIQPFGNTSVVVTDSEGRAQEIAFSRPTARFIHVRVRRELYIEEQYPANGDQSIRSAIVAWAEENQSIGVDVIRQRLLIPIYSVSGVGGVEIGIGVTDNPEDPPVFSAENVSILEREFAAFAADRVAVEALTQP